MVVLFQLKTEAAPCDNRAHCKKGHECIGALGCSAVGVLRNQYAKSLAALLIALREFHFECIEEQLGEQNELRDRGIDMTELPAARRLLPISFLFISQNGGNICLRKTSPFFLFGRGLRATPLVIKLRRRNLPPSKVLGGEHDREIGGCIYVVRKGRLRRRYQSVHK